MGKDDSTLVWHYTTLPAFIALMEKESFIYATHTDFINDSEEISTGQKIILDYIKNKFPDKFPIIQERCIKEKPFKSYYITSFSYCRDDIAMWRAYAPTGGFSLGFDVTLIKDQDIYNRDELRGGNNNIKVAIGSCLYYDKLKYILLEKIGLKSTRYALTGIGDFLKKKLRFDSPEADDEYIFSYIDLFSCVLKNISFSTEKEFRFCASGIHIEPYIEIIGNKPRIKLFPLENRFIKSIIISPHGNIDYNYKMAKILCKIRGLDENIVQKSDLSYNGY